MIFCPIRDRFLLRFLDLIISSGLSEINCGYNQVIWFRRSRKISDLFIADSFDFPAFQTVSVSGGGQRFGLFFQQVDIDIFIIYKVNGIADFPGGKIASVNLDFDAAGAAIRRSEPEP